MPKSDLDSARSENIFKATLCNYSTIHLRETEKKTLVRCSAEESTTRLVLHSYLKTTDSYVVLRHTLGQDTPAAKLATFSRIEWAKEFITKGGIECKGMCIHGKECRQKRLPYNNSSPLLRYCYMIVGRGVLRIHGQLFSYADGK